MAEGPDPGTKSMAAATPTLKELSNALDLVVDWYSLGVKLGLEDHELSTIERNYHGDGNERCKREMLVHWLRNTKLPTWKAVADALHLIGEHKVALKTRTKYCSSSTATAPATPTLKELSNALESVTDWHSLGVNLGMKAHELATIEKNYHGDNERCKLETLNHCLQSAKLPSWRMVADTLQQMGENAVASRIQAKYCSSFTATDTGTPSATSPQTPDITVAIALAQRNILVIKGKFSILVTKSCRKLQSRKINAHDVQTFLVTVYSSPHSKDGSDTVTTVVESAKSLDEIFRALTKLRLWDYINYYLLQSIIEQFAGDDDELNRMMEQYQHDLTGHILTVRIQTYLEATKHPVAMSDSDNLADEVIPLKQDYNLFRKLSAKCEVNVTNHTLSYVIDLWRSLARQFALPRPAMILHHIAEGCICITWLIPANLVEYVTRMAQKATNMFAEEHVLRVMLEEQCIYSMETELVTEPSLLETEIAALKRKELGVNMSHIRSRPSKSHPELEYDFYMDCEGAVNKDNLAEKLQSHTSNISVLSRSPKKDEGLLSSHDFLAGLAFQVFHSTQSQLQTHVHPRAGCLS